jgi:large subunit ribosomal protein L23
MSILDRLRGKKEEKAGKPEKKAPKKVSDEKKSKTASEKKLIAKREKTIKADKPKKETKSRIVAKKNDNIAYKVLLENLISEKSTMMTAENKYVFRVDPRAGKNQIKEAIEGYYGVRVTGVNTIRIHPKKRIQGRTIGWKKGYKKAIVTLEEGDTITAVEGV